MTEKITLAVNQVLNDARLACARMGMLAPTIGLDAKHESARGEYGFRDTLEFDDLYKFYGRGGIGKRSKGWHQR